MVAMKMVISKSLLRSRVYFLLPIVSVLLVPLLEIRPPGAFATKLGVAKSFFQGGPTANGFGNSNGAAAGPPGSAAPQGFFGAAPGSSSPRAGNGAQNNVPLLPPNAVVPAPSSPSSAQSFGNSLLSCFGGLSSSGFRARQGNQSPKSAAEKTPAATQRLVGTPPMGISVSPQLSPRGIENLYPTNVLGNMASNFRNAPAGSFYPLSWVVDETQYRPMDPLPASVVRSNMLPGAVKILVHRAVMKLSQAPVVVYRFQDRQTKQILTWNDYLVSSTKKTGLHVEVDKARHACKWAQKLQEKGRRSSAALYFQKCLRHNLGELELQPTVDPTEDPRWRSKKEGFNVHTKTSTPLKDDRLTEDTQLYVIYESPAGTASSVPALVYLQSTAGAQNFHQLHHQSHAMARMNSEAGAADTGSSSAAGNGRSVNFVTAPAATDEELQDLVRSARSTGTNGMKSARSPVYKTASIFQQTSTIVKMLTQLVEAVSFLQVTIEAAHHDLQAQNLFWSPDTEKIVITDFASMIGFDEAKEALAACEQKKQARASSSSGINKTTGGAGSSSLLATLTASVTSNADDAKTSKQREKMGKYFGTWTVGFAPKEVEAGQVCEALKTMDSVDLFSLGSIFSQLVFDGLNVVTGRYLDVPSWQKQQDQRASYSIDWTKLEEEVRFEQPTRLDVEIEDGAVSSPGSGLSACCSPKARSGPHPNLLIREYVAPMLHARPRQASSPADQAKPLRAPIATSEVSVVFLKVGVVHRLMKSMPESWLSPFFHFWQRLWLPHLERKQAFFVLARELFHDDLLPDNYSFVPTSGETTGIIPPNGSSSSSPRAFQLDGSVGLPLQRRGGANNNGAVTIELQPETVPASSGFSLLSTCCRSQQP
ncbi:unnamed protein product [Amoebophrya sp. A120]|nr:unnamed protein product [Amoebophrya sp. A120]|eukprot:GSA120T00024226001.1